MPLDKQIRRIFCDSIKEIAIFFLQYYLKCNVEIWNFLGKTHVDISNTFTE